MFNFVTLWTSKKGVRMKKILSFGGGTIARGFLLVLPLILLWIIATEIGSLSQAAFHDVSVLFFGKDYLGWDVILFLATLFGLGLITYIRFFDKIGDFLLYIPIVGHLVKYFNEMRGLMDILKQRGAILVHDQASGSWMLAVLVSQFHCAGKDRFNLVKPLGHWTFPLHTMDGDTLALATLNWNDALAFWMSGNVVVPKRMENLQEITLGEYWRKISDAT